MGTVDPVTPYTRQDEERKKNGCGTTCLLLLWRPCLILAAVLALFVWALSYWVVVNTACDPKKLEGQPPPFGGALVPDHLALEPHETFWGFSQQLDVWTAQAPFSSSLGPRVGSFYDVRIPWLFFGLAYQDEAGRVWFHAKTPGFFQRLSWWPGAEYELTRCDAEDVSDGTGSYRVKEEWWEGSWFCFHNCRRVYTLRQASAPGGKYEPVARASFDSAAKWVFGITRHEWSMMLTDPQRTRSLAVARSHVYPAPGTSKDRAKGKPFRLLSRWTIDAGDRPQVEVPNWAAAFLAAMDEMEGEQEELDDAVGGSQGETADQR